MTTDDGAVCKLLRSLDKNSVEEIELKMTGEVPEWLVGCLVRNGPGRFEYGNKVYKHLFDGLACVHKFKISKTKVTYSNRFIESSSLQSASSNRFVRNSIIFIKYCNNKIKDTRIRIFIS